MERRDLERLTEDSTPLLETWNRSGTTGAGVDVLKRKQSTLSLLAFYAEDNRLPIPLAQVYSKGFESRNDKKEARGKNLNYEKEDKETREGLDISRRTEWEKWKKFVAGRPIRGEELQKLLDLGHAPIRDNKTTLTRQY